MIDLKASRRDMFSECRYFKQVKSEIVVSLNTISIDEIPGGTFWAKEINSYTSENQTIADSFMMQRSSVTIMTRDDVDSLEQNDIVEYEGERWRVENKQVDYVKSQRQYIKGDLTKTTYISLRR